MPSQITKLATKHGAHYNWARLETSELDIYTLVLNVATSPCKLSLLVAGCRYFALCDVRIAHPSCDVTRVRGCNVAQVVVM